MLSFASFVATTVVGVVAVADTQVFCGIVVIKGSFSFGRGNNPCIITSPVCLGVIRRRCLLLVDVGCVGDNRWCCSRFAHRFRSLIIFVRGTGMLLEVFEVSVEDRDNSQIDRARERVMH